MKKLMIFVLFAFCATLISQPITAASKNNVKGTWEYKVPYAPYEYSKGKLVFAESNGKNTLAIKFMDGSELQARNLKIENTNISFEATVEGNYIKFTGKLVNGKITGQVDSPQGLMDLTAEKQK